MNLTYNGLKVLSLCGGIETGLIALDHLNIPISEYHTYEILPEAIAVSKYHYPWIVHHGNLIGADFEQYKGFDLVIGGMCYESLSRVRIENKNISNGLLGKSGIVYELERAIEEIHPKWFMAENVKPSNPKDLAEINRIMKTKGVLINSALFTAQDRERYYWTNINYGSLPIYNNLILENILEPNVESKYFYNKDFKIIDLNKRVCASLEINSMEMNKRVYNSKFKSPTLTKVSGGYQEKKVLDKGRPRKLTELEYERLQGLPDNYTKVKLNNKYLSYTKRCSLVGNAWTLPVIEHIFNGLIVNKYI